MIALVLHWQDLEELKEQFEKLKLNSTNQNVSGEAKERLKNITTEAENLAKYVADKMKETEGMISQNSCMHRGNCIISVYKMNCFFVPVGFRLGSKDSGLK